VNFRGLDDLGSINFEGGSEDASDDSEGIGIAADIDGVQEDAFAQNLDETELALKK